MWTGSEAVGHGTEVLDSCNPNCAAGTQYTVAVTVTFSDPVRDCPADGSPTWVWTKATFSWPSGLPAALSGQNAPINPWTFSQLASAATASCG